MSEERKYIPPAQRSIDQLADLYTRVERAPVSRAPVAGPERPVKDPFGLAEAAPDPIEAAKEVTVRLVKFFVLACGEWQLTPEAMIFAAELMALNILNAKDVPLSPERLMAVRQKAFAYYQQSLAEIPEPKAAPRPRTRR